MNIEESTYNFSVRGAEIVRYLKEEGLEFPLSEKQADYIIEMAAKSGYLTETQTRPTRSECNTLLKLLIPEPKPHTV